MSYLIAVDGGHGLETAGKETPPIPEDWFSKKKGERIKEKEFNRAVVDYLMVALNRCGFKTIDVSPGTTDVPLVTRYTAANNAKADAFISKHYNALRDYWEKEDRQPKGIETIVSQYAGDDTKKLAKFVQDELVKAHKRVDRGVKTDIQQSGINIAVLRNAAMPAILTESGFMDNLAEAKTMLDTVFQKADAEATCKGICLYFNVPYTEETKESIATVPAKTITKDSSKEDIKWLQEKLNEKLLGHSYIPLYINGVYCNKTRIAVLMYWESLQWNKEGKDDGWRAGEKTITQLNK